VTSSGRIAAGVVVALLAATDGAPVAAHAGLRFSSPLDGSTLGAAPTHLQLTFVERPEPSLTTIRVGDTAGVTYQIGSPEPLAGDPLTLTIGVRDMPRGVYTVQWRVVSAIDGHATAGAFAFGVEVAPTGPAAIDNSEAGISWLEVGGRSLFLLGLIVALGAATFAVLPLGPAPWSRVATLGTVASAAGLVLLILAQWRVAEAGVGAFAGTAIGRASLARAGALAVMAIGIWLATRLGAGLLWLAACGAIAVHAAAGHAAAGRLPVAATVIVHAVHVVAAGAWIGGLVVLIAGLRDPSVHPHRTIRRFSNLAAAGLAVVTMTGVARTIHEVGGWAEFDSSYGALVIAKVALLIAIAALGAVNRWRHVPAAATDTRPLRRTARAEIALAAIAIVAAGSLATLPPPAAANVLAGIEASGSDFATTVSATLTAVSDQPGPNRFNVAVEDYDSGEAITPDRISLMFTPIDDPGVVTTTLVLSQAEDGVFTGTGANLSFDGRWRINVLIERANTSADVALEIEARGRPQRVSVLRVPNQPPVYGIDVARVGTVAVVVDPEKPGPTRLQISCHGLTTDPFPVRDMVVTIASDEVPVQSLVIRRQDRHEFTTATTLRRGTNRISVVARTESGARLRATLEVVIANRD
jgi:copper transport protein